MYIQQVNYIGVAPFQWLTQHSKMCIEKFFLYSKLGKVEHLKIPYGYDEK